MTNRKRRRWLTWTLPLSGLVWLSGCGLSVGPRVEDRIIFVRPGPVARVAESKTVEVLVEKDGTVYRAKQEIGGWYVLPPEAVEADKQ